jgi:Coenzyme PQQ synthesis protein D (PqqD)
MAPSVESGAPDPIDARLEVRPHADVVAQRIEDDVVLVHLGTNEIYVLNRTAGRAWELLSQGHPRADIPDCLAAEFETEVGVAASELERLAEELVSRGLAERL